MFQTSADIAASRRAGWAKSVLVRIEAGLGSVCAAILAVLLIIVLCAVALRYIFGAGLLGSDELAIWLHVALIAFGAPLSINSALAMRLDVFVRPLPARAQAAAAIVADVFVVLSGLVLCFPDRTG